MPTAKRLANEDGLRGTPAVGSAQHAQKRGLKGDMGGPRFSDKDGTEFTGVTAVATGDAGIDSINAFPGRGASIGPYTGDPKVTPVDNRSVLDSDKVVPGTSDIAALATFTVATGTNGAGTFEATPANAGGFAQVLVFARGTDTDEDGELLLVREDVPADGTAEVITVPTGPNFTPGDTVAVYARRQSTEQVAGAAVAFGRFFGTRRTVTTDDA